MKRICFLLTIITIIIGCKKHEGDILINSDNLLFYAGFADEATKTYVDGELKMFWHNEDNISVFKGTAYSQEYKFIGETGDKYGIFQSIDDNIRESARLVNYAVYPYKSANYLENNILNVELPSNQTFVNGSFGRGDNTMVAVTSDATDMFLPFRNVCGYLKVKLYGESVSISRIIINGNNNEKISGRAEVAIEYGNAPEITMNKMATNSITLNCGDNGVQIGETDSAATDFWFVIPPTIFDDGLTITIVGTDGSIMSKSLKKSCEIERNIVKSLAPLKVEYEKSENTIYYTSHMGKMISIFDINSKFDSDVISHTFTDGVGKIVFKSPVSVIKTNAFSDCDITSISLPKEIKTIEKGAFEGCRYLQSFEVPESIEDIASGAFEGCERLDSFSGKFSSQDGKCLIVNNTLVAFAPKDVTNYTVPNGVTEIGECVFKSNEKLLSIIIPDGVKHLANEAFESCNIISVILPQGLESIGEKAFYNCQKLTSITLKSGLKTIGSSAFYNCISLTSIEIPSGTQSIGEAETFRDCRNLSNVRLPESLTVLPDSCFMKCYNLSSINIPSNVTHIPSNAFSYSKLQKIVLPQNLTHIENSAFARCSVLDDIYIPDKVEYIGPSAFAYCSKLSSVALPDKVTIIEDRCFEYCQELSSLSMSDNVKIIKGGAFNGCSALTTITLSKALEEIQVYAFDHCISLEEVSLPNTLKILESSFMGCEKLKTIEIPKSVVSIGSFSGCSSLESISIPSTQLAISEYMFNGCSSLTTITIPENVTSIGVEAFNGCSKLTSINIPANVTSIRERAFSGCENLTSITIPKGIGVIYDSTFDGCSKLASVTLPDDLVTIGRRAFHGCTSLSSIELPNSLLNIGEYAFSSSALNSIDLNKVTMIKDYAFAACHLLKTITFPQGTEKLYLGYYVFDSCSELTEVSIPELLTSVPIYTFNECVKLSKVVLPETISEIDNAAFAKCNSLSTIVSYALNPPVCRTDVFRGLNESTVNNMKIYVPTISIEQYRAADVWKLFTSFYSVEGL